MKKTFGIYVGLLTLMMAFVNPLQAQSTVVDLDRKVSLEATTKTEEFAVTVGEKASRLDIMIQSWVSAGELTIEIYDPAGEKVGNFSVGNQMQTEVSVPVDGKEEQVKGRISKNVKEPAQGRWVVKVIPQKTTGKVEMRSRVHFD